MHVRHIGYLHAPEAEGIIDYTITDPPFQPAVRTGYGALATKWLAQRSTYMSVDMLDNADNYGCMYSIVQVLLLRKAEDPDLAVIWPSSDCQRLTEGSAWLCGL